MPLAGIAGLISVLLEDMCEGDLVAVQLNIVPISTVGMRVTARE
jgi:hypothetical protein